MILIKKKSAPHSLIEYKRSINASFDNLPKNVKDDLRTSLLKEQGYLCAYCMKKLSDNSSEVKIEHYIARNEENELDYNNLLAVCKGNEGEPFEKQTCDTRKGNSLLTINPQKEKDISTISYTSNGEIKSTNPCYQNELDNILNLNDTLGLVELRKNTLNSLKKHLYKKHKNTSLTRESLEKIYKKLLSEDIKEAYVGIKLYYLMKKINKAQKRR